ncbi:Ankyrin [hydrothermal vent metagenome]|uniref:Ankyrin n=1 Tax=hydrothermal vent metagenome TaxID=652676 RepID=A0A1W1C568_9ZZZZ
MMDKWLELLKNDDYIGIKKYIQSGAGDISQTNEMGESVLACALRAGCSMDTLLLLCQNGADIFDFDNEGVSIFDMAVAHDNKEMVLYLIEQGKDVNETTRRSGFSALMAAACYGRVEIARILLAHGADKNAQDRKGFTAVDFARKTNKKSILSLFEE